MYNMFVYQSQRPEIEEQTVTLGADISTLIKRIEEGSL